MGGWIKEFILFSRVLVQKLTQQYDSWTNSLNTVSQSSTFASTPRRLHRKTIVFGPIRILDVRKYTEWFCIVLIYVYARNIILKKLFLLLWIVDTCLWPCQGTVKLHDYLLPILFKSAIFYSFHIVLVYATIYVLFYLFGHIRVFFLLISLICILYKCSCMRKWVDLIFPFVEFSVSISRIF